jgi:uncharacterized protein YaiL (DUF2058 family)
MSSESLRDQLLRAGLGKKAVEKPRPAAAGKPKAQVHAKPQPPKRKEGEIDLAQAYAQRARTERNEHEQAQREAERIAREKKERKHKLAALLAGKALNAAEADVPRHFPHGNKIRRIYCTKAQVEKLNRGELAVVQLAGRYLLVARDIAMQAQAIQPESLVLLCDPNAPAEDDVPADLMW